MSESITLMIFASERSINFCFCLPTNLTVLQGSHPQSTACPRTPGAADLEKCLVFTGGIALGVAAAGFIVITELGHRHPPERVRYG